VVTISVGVATIGPDAEAATDLLQRADDALFAAKRAGRNRVKPADSNDSGRPPAVQPPAGAS
jgi:diguanylate cyclase (GGDEF)-like protein